MYTGIQVVEMDISICAHFLYSEIDWKLIVNVGLVTTMWNHA